MLVELSRGNKVFQRTLPDEGQPIAVVDIDDVVYPCTRVLLNHLNERYKKQVSMDAITRLRIEEHFPELEDPFLQYLINGFSDYMDNASAYSYAKPVIELLKDHGFYVLFVTARGFHPEGYRYSHTFLKDSDIHFDCLATVRIGQSKLDFVLDHFGYDVHLLVEDSASVISEFKEYDSSVRIIKANRPWNSHVEGCVHLEEYHDAEQAVSIVKPLLQSILEGRSI